LWQTTELLERTGEGPPETRHLSQHTGTYSVRYFMFDFKPQSHQEKKKESHLYEGMMNRKEQIVAPRIPIEGSVTEVSDLGRQGK
jgi:hypothetical protein